LKILEVKARYAASQFKTCFRGGSEDASRLSQEVSVALFSGTEKRDGGEFG
jgi:hypothetical protein